MIRSPLKLATVVFSALLVAGFVAYRGGGMLPSTKSSRIIRAESADERAVLPGSKNSVIVPATTQLSRDFLMSSSKSGRIVEEADVTYSDAATHPVAEAPRRP